MKKPALRPPLNRSFYARETRVVARELLGKALVSRTDGILTGGLIVETEAYLPLQDPACHAARGMTRRNATMFGACGHLYVYAIHAKFCLNAVTEDRDRGCAVLIRGLEPLWGMGAMMERRGREVTRDLTRGPARLCQALGISKPHDGIDLTTCSDISIHPYVDGPFTIRVGPRIGISQGAELPLRFFVDQNLYVSGRAADHSAPPTPSASLALSPR